MLHVVVNLFAYVRGCATNVEMELESEQDTGLTEDEWLELQGAQFASVLASGRYPHLARMVAAPDVDLDLDMDALFEFRLERLLDGYAALIQTGDPSTHIGRPSTELSAIRVINKPDATHIPYQIKGRAALGQDYRVSARSRLRYWSYEAT